MVQAPTGAGKTRLAAEIVDGALHKGNRVVFTVPALSLIDQTVEAFWREGIRDIGVIQASHELTNGLKPVQVASVQTLMRRPLPEAEVVIIDEAHRWFDIYGRWMADPAWAQKPFIGLSATPWTQGLGKHFDDLIIATTTAELIEAGYLSKFRVYAPSHPDLSKVRTVAGDYHEGDLSDAMDKPELTADVVDTWRARGEDRPTFVFAVDRAHAKHLQTRFEEAGIGAGYIDAYTEAEERNAIQKRFHAGEIRVVCNVGCLTTGIDWDVRCIVLARPTKSEMLFVQIIGRGLRRADGKDSLLVLDHSDTHLRLGMVTDIGHDELDDGKPRQKQAGREKSTPLPKECPSCSFLKPAGARACPACGFAPERGSEVRVEDGELVELQAKKSTKRLDHAKRLELYGMLRHYGAMRGFKAGWADHKYREKTGHWPQSLKHARHIPPSPELLNWLKSRAIAYAKGSAKRSLHGHDMRGHGA
jgi:superfamily II DNA or RNA helicase